MGMKEHLPIAGMGLPGVWGMRMVLAFGLGQSVHYWMWIRLVPEEARAYPTTRSFSASWQSLRMEMGGWVMLATFAAALWVAGWAVFDLVEARSGYLQFIRFHGVLELAAAAILFIEGRSILSGKVEP